MSAGDVLLSVNRYITTAFRLNRCVDRVAAADELMESEGKHGEPGFGMLDLKATHEHALNRGRAVALVFSGRLSQLSRRPARHRPRHIPNQPPRRVRTDTEGRLDP